MICEKLLSTTAVYHCCLPKSQRFILVLILVQVQHLSHRGSRFLFRLLVGVRVNIKRGRYIGMTEKFLNLLDVHSLRQKQTACCMT